MKSVAIIPLVLGIMFAAVPAARADTLCTETNPGLSGMINGNVVVPDGAACDLRNATVTGNVLVQKGAILFVGLDAPVTISGNLQADQCASVILSNGGAPVSVGGNVRFDSCTGPGVIGLLGPVTIHGNFLCQSNSAPCVAENGSIDGNANVSNNSGGTSFVVGNQIGGNLLCFGNTDVSDGGLSNTVAGKKLGQCAGL